MWAFALASQRFRGTLRVPSRFGSQQIFSKLLYKVVARSEQFTAGNLQLQGFEL